MPVKGNEPDATTTTTGTTQVEAPAGVIIGRGLRILGETRVPGASQILDGKLKSGVFHIIAAVAARALIGGVGVALVAADSYSKSTSGKGLLERVRS
jgi:hypothetical protein